MKKTPRKPFLAFGLCLFGNVLARMAWAEPSTGDRSMAAQLFQEGRSLLEQGRFDQACPKLEESERLDPGGGTLLNVALCHEKQGRTATAWVEFVEARGIARADSRSQRVAFAQAHIEQLEPMLSRIEVQVPNGSDLPDLEIKRDGSVVGRAAWGSAVPVDPGDHVVEVSAPGKVAWKQQVVIGAAGDKRTVVVPVLQSAPVATAPASQNKAMLDAASLPAGASDRESPAEAPAPSNRGERARELAFGGWASLAVGAGAAAVSTYFGLRALALKNDADRDCQRDTCSALGSSQNHDAIRAADISTGFAVAGAVGVGAGTALLILSATSAPRHESRTPAASRSKPGLVGVDVSGGLGMGAVTVRGGW